MRPLLLFSFLFSFFLPLVAFSQDIKNDKPATPNANIACKVGENRNGPLYILNGVPVEPFDIRHIDPQQIESINILKNEKAAMISCYNSGKDIILVHLKKDAKPRLHIRSKDDGSPVYNAAVIFRKKNDVINGIARYSDTLGHVDLAGLENMTEYEIAVEEFTHKSHKGTIRIIPGVAVKVELEKEAVEMQEVVVSSSGCRIIRCTRVCCNMTKDTARLAITESKTLPVVTTASLFPNPVASGRSVTFTVDQKSETQATIQVHNLGGQLMFQQSTFLKTGYQKINIPVNTAWTKGMYLLSAKTKSGFLAREKFIVE